MTFEELFEGAEDLERVEAELKEHAEEMELLKYNEYWDDDLKEGKAELPVPEGPYERELEQTMKYETKAAEKRGKIAKIFHYLEDNDLM
jgi:hypothetical protein